MHDYVRIPGEDGHLQAKERVETNLAHTVILDFQCLELERNVRK